MNRGYHEIKEHGKREFPFNIYPCSIPVDFSHVALHWHEEMEIIAVKKGKGRITVDTVSYPVEEGDILAVFPGQLHGWNFRPSRDTRKRLHRLSGLLCTVNQSRKALRRHSRGD